MTAYEFAGSGVIILGAAIWGRMRASEERKKLKTLADFRAFANFAGESIGRAKMPLREIYSSYPPASRGMKLFLEEAAASDIRTAWEKFPPQLPVEVRDCAKTFVFSLGRGYSDEEKEKCALCSSVLGEYEKKLTGDIGSREKLYTLLPPLLAASALIVLI